MIASRPIAGSNGRASAGAAPDAVVDLSPESSMRDCCRRKFLGTLHRTQETLISDTPTPGAQRFVCATKCSASARVRREDSVPN